MSPTTTANALDRWIKVASVIASCAILPGIGWAFHTSSEIHDMRGRIEALATRLEGSSQSSTQLLEEIRAIRSSVESLRSEVLQRITRVETQIDGHIKSDTPK